MKPSKEIIEAYVAKKEEGWPDDIERAIKEMKEWDIPKVLLFILSEIDELKKK